MHHHRPSPPHGMHVIGMNHVPAQGRRDRDGQNQNNRAQRRQGEKWHMPTEARGHHQPQGHSQNHGPGKRRHHESHRRAPSFEWNHIADDRQNHRANHAAEGARHRPRRNQQMIARGQRAKQRSQGEPEQEPKQRPLAVETVEDEARGHARNPRAHSIGGDNQAKLLGVDVKHPLVLRPQRQDDEKIQDRRKLDRRQREQEHSLARRRPRPSIDMIFRNFGHFVFVRGQACGQPMRFDGRKWGMVNEPGAAARRRYFRTARMQTVSPSRAVIISFAPERRTG